MATCGQNIEYRDHFCLWLCDPAPLSWISLDGRYTHLLNGIHGSYSNLIIIFKAFSRTWAEFFRRTLYNCIILILEIRKVFDAIDEDGNGKITKNELERLLLKLNKNATKTELNKMFQIADKDGNNINIHCPTI